MGKKRKNKKILKDIFNIIFYGNYTPTTKFGDYFSFFFNSLFIIIFLFLVFYVVSIIPFDRDAAVLW